IEFIEFWMQNPFTNRVNSNGGDLYFHLGNLSEDVLKDGRRQFENGLPTPSSPATPTDETVWGRVPRNPQQVTNAFSNDPADRPFQDVGFDGLQDSAEQRKFAPYVQQLQSIVTDQAARQALQADPSNDNFRHYRDAAFSDNTGILERYKNINNPQGNSPVANSADQFSSAFTLYPDQEELNRDNTLNETEAYFQYRVHLEPNMLAGTNYITDIRDVPVRLADGSTRNEKWYLFRIPIQAYYYKTPNIPDFKSIRFMRMFLTGFDDTLVARFGKLELVRNQWRKFTNEIDTLGNVRPPVTGSTTTEVLAVNLEENDQREPIPYRTPPGIDRQQQLSNNNVQLLQNEQALSVRVCGLQPNESRGVFKTLNMDLRQYGSLSMFIHAESSASPGNDIKDGEMQAVIRIGSDFVSNYYEIKIPLRITPWGTKDSGGIWPSGNSLELDLEELA
ncbi:MAG: cell surface protein SprA, partial [Chitinophagaceae bacterium]